MNPTHMRTLLDELSEHLTDQLSALLDEQFIRIRWDAHGTNPALATLLLCPQDEHDMSLDCTYLFVMEVDLVNRLLFFRANGLNLTYEGIPFDVIEHAILAFFEAREVPMIIEIHSPPGKKRTCTRRGYGAVQQDLVALLDELHRDHPGIRTDDQLYNQYKFRILFEDPMIRLSHFNNDYFRLRTSKDVQDAKEKNAAMLTDATSATEEVVSAIRAFDPTCHYDPERRMLILLNQNVPFSIHLHREDGKLRYQARIHSSRFKRNETAPLVKKAIAALTTHFKKGRISSAMEGRGNWMLPRLFREVCGLQNLTPVFGKDVICSLSAVELNEQLLRHADTFTKEVLDPFYADYFQQMLRLQKKRNTVKQGVRLAGFYVFVSSTQLFLLTPEEFDAASITHGWKQKKDQDLAEDLEAQKPRFLSV